ncbi:hypothetical protein ACH4D3_37510 [Streptomyces sp. NPDC018026]|uniref:hypothetical protein n=1 Tax=Streptomyces sp. NPDC018026 TaxID=3365031 RepID=UPI0037936D47
MSTEQHDANAYGQELARISPHHHKAAAARLTVFQALVAVGIGHEQAEDIVAKLEAGAVVGAPLVSESSAPHGPELRFENGWHAGVRDVASYLLCIADATAITGRGLTASGAMLIVHLQQPASPALQEDPVDDPGWLHSRTRRTSWRPQNASRGPWPRAEHQLARR